MPQLIFMAVGMVLLLVSRPVAEHQAAFLGGSARGRLIALRTFVTIWMVAALVLAL